MVPKIPPLPYRKVHRLLLRHGFQVIGQTGSHVKYAHPDGRRTVVPHHSGDLGTPLLAEIAKQAGIDPAELRR